MRHFNKVTAWSAGITLSLALAAGAAAADKAGRLSGTVISMDKDRSEITIQQGTAHRIAVFNSATKFSSGAVANSKTVDPATPEQVQAGTYVVCVGTWDNVKLAATACTVRPSKRP